MQVRNQVLVRSVRGVLLKTNSPCICVLKSHLQRGCFLLHILCKPHIILYGGEKMQSYLSVKNLSSSPSISVYCDDCLLFADILNGGATYFHKCSSGSRVVTVLNSRENLIFDLWLSFMPGKRHILEVYDDYCRLISAPSA